MGEFDAIANSAESKMAPEPNVVGTFQCQVCSAVTHEAFYDNIDKILVWKCNDGHKSIIEELSL